MPYIFTVSRYEPAGLADGSSHGRNDGLRVDYGPPDQGAASSAALLVARHPLDAAGAEGRGEHLDGRTKDRRRPPHADGLERRGRYAPLSRRRRASEGDAGVRFDCDRQDVGFLCRPRAGLAGGACALADEGQARRTGETGFSHDTCAACSGRSHRVSPPTRLHASKDADYSSVALREWAQSI